MERHRKQLDRTLVLASALIAGIATFLLPLSLQAQTQAQPKGIDPGLMAKANAGDAKSQLLVGFAYGKGDGVLMDLDQAAEWYRKAAENGNATAQVILGLECLDGLGVPKDKGQSDKWFRKAGAQADMIDLVLLREYQYFPIIGGKMFFYLGSLYEDGKDLPQDYSQAAFWYREGAKRGDVFSQVLLGMQYSDGKGVPQDYAQAAAWFHKAADQGDVEAQSNLGGLYLTGRGVPQDFVEAAKWLNKAADRGLPIAQYNLGTMYALGQGVPQSAGVAYFWFDLAAAGLKGQDQENAAKNRDLCATQLTSDQLSKVQELAAKWFAEHPSRH
jgi:TPR repeat protein